MRRSSKTLLPVLFAAVSVEGLCMVQNMEPLFTWAGKNSRSFIREGGTEGIDPRFELSLDEQGIVARKTSNEDGTANFKHVFYTDMKPYDAIPGLFTRKIVVVFLLIEDADTPMVSVLNGRLPAGRFLYGEEMLTRSEQGSNTAKSLGIGNPKATSMAEDELPDDLKSALENGLPIGIVKMEGDYKEQETKPATEPQKGDAIDLFNKKDLEGWYIYLTEADIDPNSVWKVRDGAIWCAGTPTGFLRTNREYSDYRLVLEWRWPEKPGNSGVLLHMGGEDKIWPQCMEAQLMHNRAGDFVGMGCKFNENKNTKEGAFIHYTPRMNESNEKDPGAWNTYEIVCKGDTIEATINGRLQNKATGVSLCKGYIGLQGEGVPIVFRNIKLTSLGGGKAMPEQVIPTRLKGSYAVNGEIHVNTFGAPEGKPLTTGHQDMKPSWSKTGGMLVFFRVTRFASEIPDWKTAICVVNVDGTGFRKLTDGAHTDFNPTWTRDGSNLPIFNRKKKDGRGYVVMQSKPDGRPGDEVAISDPRYHTYAYSCLEDGRIFVSSSRKPGGYFLMTPGRDGKATYEPIRCELAKKGLLDRVSISPDESKVCFEFQKGFGAYRYPGRTLYIADFDAEARTVRNPRAIANEAGDRDTLYLYPRWMKDASAVAYHCNKTGKNQLYMYRLKDGLTIRVSTNGDANYMFPHGEETPK